MLLSGASPVTGLRPKHTDNHCKYCSQAQATHAPSDDTPATKHNAQHSIHAAAAFKLLLLRNCQGLQKLLDELQVLRHLLMLTGGDGQ